MNKKIALAVWVLALLLSMVLLFTLNQSMTAAFWITFVFVVATFCSTLLFQCVLGKNAKTPDDRLLKLPSALISVIYALCSGIIPWKVALLVHVIILILAWILILSGLAGNGHIRNVNGRQKNHHTEL